MAALEGGVAALATASGAAAITYAVQNIAHAGDHIVSSQSVYGGTYNLFAHTLTESGIETTFVDGDSRRPSQPPSAQTQKPFLWNHWATQIPMWRI